MVDPPDIGCLTECTADKKTEALAIVGAFAAENGWSSQASSLSAVRVLVAPSQEALRQFLLGLDKLQGDDPPALLAAALPGTIAITDEPVIRCLRPEYLGIERGWVRVLAHEFVHLLHQAIIGGDEDGMGPPWFYEGFACLGAGQQLGRSFAGCSPERVIAALSVEGRERYPIYEAAVRFFAKRHALRVLVEQARLPGFQAWLTMV